MHLFVVLGYEDQDKPSVFTEVLRPRFNYKESKKTLQVEIHVFISPTEIRASILLNKLRLMGIFDLILELKSFIIDKLEEDIEEGKPILSLLREDLTLFSSLL